MASTSIAAKSYNKDRGVWLVEGTLESITRSKLSSFKKYFAGCIHLHSYEKKTIQSSAAITTREVFDF